MSPIDFATFRSDHPDLGPVWDALKIWRDRFPSRQYLDVRELASISRDIGTSSLLAAVEVLIESGALRQIYKAVDPIRHVPIGDEYNSPTDVPDRVRGPFDEWVDTTDAEIVPLLREV